jgi:hypothetical protein
MLRLATSLLVDIGAYSVTPLMMVSMVCIAPQNNGARGACRAPPVRF